MNPQDSVGSLDEDSSWDAQGIAYAVSESDCSWDSHGNTYCEYEEQDAREYQYCITLAGLRNTGNWRTNWCHGPVTDNRCKWIREVNIARRCCRQWRHYIAQIQKTKMDMAIKSTIRAVFECGYLTHTNVIFH